jgi:hydrogenase maturation protease
MPTLVIGIGNPILGDDGIGIWVARLIKGNLPNSASVEVRELCRGGVSLMEEMLGFDEVIIIDAINTKHGRSGNIYTMKPEDFKETQHLSSPHDLDFTAALKLGKELAPEGMPKEITIYAIEIETALTFKEQLTPIVETAGRKVAETILSKLMR